MHDLQLVGFTTDRRGLIFRPRAGARSEVSFVVPVTDDLVALVAEIAEERASDRPLEVEPPADPAEEAAAAEAAARPRSQLSVRDIQARLRAGEPVAQVAAEAGVEDDWIERFAPPIRAEQRRIVDRALEHHLHRSRSAPSAVPLRRAVGMALAEKGIAYTVAAFEAAWSAHLLGHDRWVVEFTYRHRGRDRTATWSYDAVADELTTSDRAAAQLGYVAPGAAGDDDGQAIDGIVGDPEATTQIGTASAGGRTRRTPSTAKRAAPATTTGAGKKRSAPTKKSTKKRATAGTAAAKKVAARKATAKKAAAAKKAATQKKATASKKAAVKKAASQKKATASKKAAVKKKATVGKKAAVKKKARVAKKATAAKRKTTATKQAPTKRKATVAKTATTKRSTARKATATKATAKTASTTTRSAAKQAAAPTPGPARPEAAPAKATAIDQAERVAPPAPEARAVEPATPVEAADRPVGSTPRLPDESPRRGRAGLLQELDPSLGRPVASRPGEVPMTDIPLARRPPASNGRPDEGDQAAAPDAGLADGPDERPTAAPDPASARRARAAERSVPTVQFRSGSAAPVRDAGAGDGRVRRSPEPDPPRTEPAPANGAASPATRRRRQLRAK